MRSVSRSELFKSASEAQKVLGGEAILDTAETTAAAKAEADRQRADSANIISEREADKIKVGGKGFDEYDSGRTLSTADMAAPTAENTDLSEINMDGVKTRPDYRTPAEKQAEGSSLEDKIDTGDNIFKSRVTEDVVQHITDHLVRGRCSLAKCEHNKGFVPAPVKTGPSFKRQTFSGAGAADKAWKVAMDIHDRIRSHYGEDGKAIDSQLSSKASEYDRRANAADTISQGANLKGRAANVVRNMINTARDSAGELRTQASAHVLREKLGVDNNLVEAQSILSGLKGSDGKFKFTNQADNHAFIVKAVKHLKTANGILNRSLLAKHGLGSPVSDSEMSDVANAVRYKETTTPTGEKKTKGLQVPKNKTNVQALQDIDPLLAKYDKDNNLLNPEDALSKPGHMFISTDREQPIVKNGKIMNEETAGRLRQEPISNRLLTQLKTMSTNHPDIPKLQGFLNQTRKGQREVYSGRAAVGVPVESSGGVVTRAGGPARPVGEVTKTGLSIKEQLAAEAAEPKTPRKSTAKPGKSGPKMVERITPGGMAALVKEAHDHIVAGTGTGVEGQGQVPKDLRKVLRASGTAQAMAMAKETMRGRTVVPPLPKVGQ
jgi:hypothetical protein